MADNENMVVNQAPSQDEKPSFLSRVGAGIKEWLRKQIVSLKRNPQRIALFLVVISSVMWLFCLFNFSRTANLYGNVNMLGVIVFVNTMLAILILPLFLNSFPKRKKPNFIFIALVFVFMAASIAIDVVYHGLITDAMAGSTQEWLNERPYINETLTLAIVHIVLVGISAAALALMPLYTPLIRKINTSKEVAGNDIHETIDVEDE